MALHPASSLLNKECQQCVATIDNFDKLDKNIQYQLTRLGVCKGCPISIAQNTIFSDPIIFNIQDSKIALRKKDAKNITIEIQNK